MSVIAVPIHSLRAGGPALSERDLARWEQDLGIRLPAEYRAFLLDSNGGQPEPARFWIRRPHSASRLQCFLAVGSPEPSDDLAGEIRALRGRLPAELIPVGWDDGGNVVCVGVEGKQRGGVFLWSRGFEAPGRGRPGPARRQVTRIAGSFRELLDGFIGDEGGAGRHG